jgi:hypothetical protein
MRNRVHCGRIGGLLHFSTCMASTPSFGPPEMANLDATVLSLRFHAAWLYFSYLLAVVVTGG